MSDPAEYFPAYAADPQSVSTTASGGALAREDDYDWCTRAWKGTQAWMDVTQERLQARDEAREREKTLREEQDALDMAIAFLDARVDPCDSERWVYVTPPPEEALRSVSLIDMDMLAAELGAVEADSSPVGRLAVYSDWAPTAGRPWSA